MLKEKSCCFSSHREIPPDKLETVRKRLEEEIIKLIEQGVIL